MKLHNVWLLKTSVKKVTMGHDKTAEAVDLVKIESILLHIMHVGSDRLSMIHVRLYVSDEILQLDLLYFIYGSSKRCPSNGSSKRCPAKVNKSVHFECKVSIGGQSKQCGAVPQEMINLKRFYFTVITGPRL